MYCSPNFKSKKELKQAVADGRPVTVFSPGPFPCPTEGEVGLEGPHYPKPHSWYATAQVANGLVVKVK
jgi:hypothetical protein